MLPPEADQRVAQRGLAPAVPRARLTIPAAEAEPGQVFMTWDFASLKL
jgi:hypothetical protein